MILDDAALLQHFATLGDEAAFRALVKRHLGLVHSVARRVTVNEDLARDVTQETFIRLAGKAGTIPASLPLAAWLHRTARSLAANLVRTETRRKQREATSVDLQGIHDGDSEWVWLSPVIDSLVDRLPAMDRNLILLRFYHGHPHAEVAARLGLNEGAARRRTLRALDKLRVLLARRGITTTASVLGALLPANAVAAAPAGLACAVAAAASTSAGGAGGSLAVKIILMSKAVKTAVAAVIVLTLLGIFIHRLDRSPTSALVAAVRNTTHSEPLASVAVVGPEAGKPEPVVRPKRPELEKRFPVITDLREEDPDVIVAKVDGIVGSGQSLVMGGYDAGDGSREFSVITPKCETGADGSRQIAYSCKFFKLDRTAIESGGLQSLVTDQRKSEQNGELWTSEDIAKIERDFPSLGSPTIISAPGQSGRMIMGDHAGILMSTEIVGLEDGNGGVNLKVNLKRATKP